MSLAETKEFHEAFGHPVENEHTLIKAERFDFRVSLIEEELEETREAWEDGNLIKFVDGLSDMGVVINGTILEFGGSSNSVDPIPTTWDDGHGTPRLPKKDSFYTWYRIITLKLDILHSVYFSGDVKYVLDILASLSYDVASHAYYYDIPLAEINKVVHKANMSKLGEDGKPIYRESDNKIMKGPNTRPPEEDIERILREHGADL